MLRHAVLASALTVIVIAASVPFASAGTAAPTVAGSPGPEGTTSPAVGTVRMVGLPDAATHPRDLVDVDGTLFFWAGGEGEPARLWSTDGTVAGTTAIEVCRTALVCGTQQRYRDFSSVAHFLFFLTSEGAWRSDGTTSGTQMIARRTARWHLVAGPYGRRGRCAVASTPTHVFLVTSTDCDDPYPQLLAAVDVDAGTVRPLPGLGASGMVTRLAAAGGRMIMFAYGDDGMELWSSDGTPRGTRRIQGRSPSSAWLTTDVQGRLFMVVGGSAGGLELWAVDRKGTRARRLGLRWPSRPEVQPMAMMALGGDALVVTMGEADCGLALWRSDGTQRGSARVATLREGDPTAGADGCAGPSIRSMAAGGLQYLVIQDSVHPDQLWRTDGTSAGTQLVRTFERVDERSVDWLLADLAGTLYFSVTGDEMAGTLWRTDGTSAGTSRVAEFTAGPYALATSRGRLYLTASDASKVTRLWVVDPAGGAPQPSPSLSSPRPSDAPRRPPTSPDPDLAALLPDGLALTRMEVVTLSGSQWVERYDPSLPAGKAALAELQRFLDRLDISIDELSVAGAIYGRGSQMKATVTAIRVRGVPPESLPGAVLPFVFAGLLKPDVTHLDVDGRQLLGVTDAELGGNYRQYVYASGDVVWVIDADVDRLTEIVRALP